MAKMSQQSIQRRVALVLVLVITSISGGGVLVHAAEDRKSMTVTLLEESMTINAKQYLHDLWMDAGFYASFLNSTGDINIEVGAWKDLGNHKMERVIVTNHPVKSPIPAGFGLPKHIRSTKTQSLYEVKNSGGEGGGSNHDHIITVVEDNVVDGIPFADRFHVVMVWEARWLGGKSTGMMALTIKQYVVYKKGFWLENVVEKNSAKETKETSELWASLAKERITGGNKKKGVTAGGGGAIKSVPSSQQLKVKSQSGGLSSLWSNEGKLKASSLLLLTGLITSFFFYSKAQAGRVKGLTKTN